jgi:nucleotide-binding universal stress UspA family protein
MPTDHFLVRRILVALDSSPGSLAALRAAVELSVRLEAQLLGLFVEDIDLLRLANSPYAREVLLPAANKIRLDRASMERKLRAHAEQAREALAETADRAGVEWKFRVARGSVPSEILSAAADCDLLALGWRGWSLSRKSRIGSAASAAVSKAVPALLLSAPATLSELHVFVWYDGTVSSKRAVLAAADLAEIASGKLTVLLSSREPESDSGLQQQVFALLRGKRIQLRWGRVNGSGHADLRDILRSEPASLIVLSGKEPFLGPLDLVAELDEIHVSALFLGKGSAVEVESS